MITIYHNPRCTKSRQTLELLQSKKLEVQVIEYLQTPPSASELDAILKKLKLEPQDVIRTKEDIYEKLDLNNKNLSRTQLIEVMIQNPILIERPIVIVGDKAAIGRPPENVLAIL